jgi:N6-L-threonylcarbamoyladenine synthase
MGKKERKLTLGIETSCDETSVAVLEGETDIRSHIVLTQDEHIRYGGVVPEIASRSHMRTLLPVIWEALRRASCELSDIDLVGVTRGPGLIGSILVGLSVAKALALSIERPIVGVNHLEAHLFANLLTEPGLKGPFVGLIVSGGHTILLKVEDWGDYKVLGRTRDDAAGEAFDKVAKILGLPYPGGPSIEEASAGGGEDFVRFPRPMADRADKAASYDFSYSGLKTAVVNFCRMQGEEAVKEHISDISAAFQKAAVELLVRKSLMAVDALGLNRIVLAGGVARNRRLRRELGEEMAARGGDIHVPMPILCTDNGAMVARTALFHYVHGVTDGLDLDAVPGLPFPSG